MKLTIVFFVICIISFSWAAPNKDAQTLHYESNVQPANYNFAVETSDGKLVQEEGVLKNIGTEDEALSVKGSYTYVGDDGVTYQVNYIADENGFQPQGQHLPVV